MRVRIGPYRKNRATRVEIEPHDTWSMDHTLAMIIHPMLVQLKATQHGHPSNLTEQEWDQILDEMIWAFEQKCRDHWEGDYYGPYIESEDKRELFGRFEWIDDKGRDAHQKRMSNGFRLFGKYFENLWD